ncbi:MAG: ABC transporter permease [Stellaceae bacterium]
MTTATWRRAAAPAGSRGVFLLCWLIGGLLGAFIVLPLLALALTPGSAGLAAAAQTVDLWQALGLSIEAAFASALIAGFAGVPLAYVLARAAFPGKGVVAAIVDLPLAVPHTVAGIALLLVLGRRGIIGAPASLLGLKFWGNFAGIVAAMLFVSVPYTVNAARIGFEAIDPRLEMIARTLGMGPWRSWLRVSLPLARRSILTGLTLTYARSISEFGAVIILAYYPMTAPVQIYTLFVRFGLDQAAAAAVLLLAVSLALFILFRQFAYGGVAHAVGGR